MTPETAKNPEPAGGRAAEPADDEGYERPTYEGSRVPWYLVLLFAAFFAWGLIYLVRFVPESWSEWFGSGGGRGGK